MLGLTGLVLAGASRAAAADPATVPEPKRSKSGLYPEAKDVPAFIDANCGPTQILFLDGRTRAEGMSVGLLTMRRKSPKRSTTKPNPISAMDVRCQASRVRSAANRTRGSSR